MKHLKLVYILLAVAFACTAKKKNTETTLGEVNFEVTGQKNAQAFFKKGLLLLHSFEYEDAAEEFNKAITIDTQFTMAYWGEAMTYNHPLWQEQDFDKGNEILNLLATTPEERMAKAKTPLEKDFIGGINILYGKGNKAERDSSYAAYMETLYNKYPGNDEVAAFYSLALNGWGTTVEDTFIFKKAAEIGNEILKRNPNHPGALHYVIHALDNPDFAKDALDVANKYAIVAKDAGHALHMPTHTYLALGLWDKLISSNEVSWAAERNRMEKKKLDNDALGYHSFHWLQYGYLQKGNSEKARQMLDSMKKFCTELSSSRARSHFFYMKATYQAETNDYSDDITALKFENKDLNITIRARNNFISGMNAYHKNDEQAMDAILTKMAADRLIEQSKASDVGIRMCGNINRSIATKKNLQVAEILELQLKAMKAWLKKDSQVTEKYLQEAVALHQKVGYSYGPPVIVKPTFEMYGEWLLETGKPKKALEQFDLSLQMAPNRLLSIKGKEKANEEINKSKLAVL